MLVQVLGTYTVIEYLDPERCRMLHYILNTPLLLLLLELLPFLHLEVIIGPTEMELGARMWKLQFNPG